MKQRLQRLLRRTAVRSCTNPLCDNMIVYRLGLYDIVHCGACGCPVKTEDCDIWLEVELVEA